MPFRAAGAAMVLCLVSAAPCAAGQPPPSDRPTLTAIRVARAPVVDGDVAGDPVWEIAPAASGFRQEQPDEGQPSSESTEVRVVYTADTLYIGVLCHDRDPSGIIVADSRRDAPLDDTDSFRIILDTYRD